MSASPERMRRARSGASFPFSLSSARRHSFVAIAILFFALYADRSASAPAAATLEWTGPSTSMMAPISAMVVLAPFIVARLAIPPAAAILASSEGPMLSRSTNLLTSTRDTPPDE